MQSKIQNPKSKILIAGAGPAGASLAIRLAQKGFSVTLVEREKFPREKLCGEFISPECFRHFAELGVLEEIISAGGDRIRETTFYAANGKRVSVPSEWFNPHETALGLSRAEMDLRILERAKAAGVSVLEDTNIAGLLIENKKAGGVRVKNKAGETYEISAALIVDATGRASVLANLARKWKAESGKRLIKEKDIQHPKSKIQNRLVGFKTHLKNACIEPGVCEIYFFPGGYGGLNLVENGLANHCFLIRADVVRKFHSDAQAIIENVIFKNKRAMETLQYAEPVHDWLAVSIDEFGMKELNPAANLLAVGDAAAFIDPFTGSGMLMALESGELLADCIAENFAADQIAARYKTMHRAKFSGRLRVCSLMRRAAFAPNLTQFAISALGFGEFPRRILARATRTLPAASNK